MIGAVTASDPEAQPLSTLRALRRDGQHDQVVAGCVAALRRTPGDLEAEHLLARAMAGRGQNDEASLVLEGLSRRAPEHPGIRCSLSRALLSVGDVEGALREAEEALRLAPPDRARALRARGLARRLAGDAAGSLGDLRAAAAADPGHVGGQGLLVQALLLDDDDDAGERVEHLAAVDPNFRASMMLMAYRFTQQGMDAAAERTLRAALRTAPSDPELLHLLDTTLGRAGDRAPDDWVREHFDRFAMHFDEALTRLDYRAPEFVTELVRSDAPEATGLDVLDAGCGTGLCGPALRHVAGTLVGVDLSGGMVAAARERGVYDAVHEDELVRWLDAHPSSYDLVVAADVLNYFGDIVPPLRATSRALREGGRAVFTLEHRAEGAPADPGFHSRWAHTTAQLEQACTTAGLVLASSERIVLRKEAGVPVDGMLVLARRPQGATS